MISASMLSRSFDGVPAVESVSFEIPEGSLFTLLGPIPETIVLFYSSDGASRVKAFGMAVESLRAQRKLQSS